MSECVLTVKDGNSICLLDNSNNENTKITLKK